MAIDEKAPSELRPIPFDLSPQIPVGASITTVQAYASRKITGLTTTLSGSTAAEAATFALADDVKAGALIIIDPGSPTNEETFKVVSVSGSGPYTVTLSHTAELPHTNGATVAYEPGWTARLVVDDTPTPLGSQVLLWVQNGADAQTYRVSVLATLDDGQIVEAERDLVVTEHAPLATEIMQVDEIRDFFFGFAEPVALAGADVDSAVAWISREVSVGATLSSAVNAGATTIPLSANPGVGALLTLNPTGAKQEKLKVSAVAGASPPYTCTVHPTPDFDHNSGEALTYEPGVSSRLLTSTTATIIGAAQAVVRKRRGAAGQTYRLTVLATLENVAAERVQGSVHLQVVES